tara:strand:- start:759 stop:1103 length:345 start_codon:yes stop_codon:yes gene_type:complete
MSALAIAIVSKYTPKPKFLDLETSLFILTIRYSKILVFCKPWLRMKSKPIVITAGFEKPDIASSTVKNPPKNNIVKIRRAVTSKLNLSVIKRIKAKRIRAKTNIISKVIVSFFY